MAKTFTSKAIKAAIPVTNNATSFIEDHSIGEIDVNNRTRVATLDNSYASIPLDGAQISFYLRLAVMGFAIPTTATIKGVVFNVSRYRDGAGTINDYSIRLAKASVPSGTDKSTAALWPTTQTTYSKGSNTDLWGLTLTPTDINHTGFGVALACEGDALDTAYIDHMNLTVYHTPIYQTKTFTSKLFS